MLKQYKQKKLVRAIQFNGKNVVEIMEVFKGKIDIYSSPTKRFPKRVVLQVDGIARPLLEGDWVVVDENDNATRCKADQFDEEYEEVGELQKHPLTATIDGVTSVVGLLEMQGGRIIGVTITDDRARGNNGVIISTLTTEERITISNV